MDLIATAYGNQREVADSVAPTKELHVSQCALLCFIAEVATNQMWPAGQKSLEVKAIQLSRRSKLSLICDGIHSVMEGRIDVSTAHDSISLGAILLDGVADGLQMPRRQRGFRTYMLALEDELFSRAMRMPSGDGPSDDISATVA